MKQNGYCVSYVSEETALYDGVGNRKYLNEQERLKFYRAALSLTDLGKRSFCLTLFLTGCRISEALNLTVSNIDFSDKALVFRTLKQRGKNRYRVAPVPDQLQALLGEHVAGDNAECPVWTFSRSTGWRTVKACMAEAGIEGAMAMPKGLRHSFAITCISKGIPLHTVQKLMGHAELKSTSVYLDFVGDDERKLVKRTWPTMV